MSFCLFHVFSFALFVQFGNKVVAQAACDVFQLLLSHWERLQRFDQAMPKKTIEVTETTQTCAKSSLTLIQRNHFKVLVTV